MSSATPYIDTTAGHVFQWRRRTSTQRACRDLVGCGVLRLLPDARVEVTLGERRAAMRHDILASGAEFAARAR